ncbi:MAG: tRNA (adenosine(37)-N6)-threonylcarbamoyltransferase complex dimerization subunit type 1 TsaB, partial [Proteobacteria bacterium]|nr:tRNA (adenosine(37)-N6)-threonylcarbamoyltransferase complex dimerization subunit type 1 TsaB [Pseudomonadota bacterium]
LALDKPVVGVSTLEAMAANFPCANRVIKPLMDARKSEVYTADFIWEEGFFKRLSDDRVEAPEKMLEGVSEDTIFVGDGLIKYGELIKDTVGDKAFFADHFLSYIRASNVARLGQARFKEKGALDLASFTPAYLRRSEAEVNREKGLLKNC